MPKPTGADVKSFLEGYNVTDTQLSDAWIEARIDQWVIPFIERKTGLTLSAEKTVTEYLSGNGTNILILSHKNVKEIVSIKYLTSIIQTSGLADAVVLDPKKGIVMAKSNPDEGTGSMLTFQKGKLNIEVKYTYGSDDIWTDYPQVTELVLCATASTVLNHIGARTGGGSLGVQSYNRNFGQRGKYTDIINQLDSKVLSILREFTTGVVGA